jgi:hypothetical protein
MNYRDPEFAILIGTNGTGKSTLAKSFANYRERCLFVPSSENDNTFDEYPILAPGESLEDFRGERRTYFSSEDSFKNFVDAQVRECLIVLDDVKNYIPNRGPVLNKSLEILLRNRRHLMNDVVLIVHHPKDLHPDLLKFDPTLILFRTTGAYSPSLATKLDYDALLQINQKVEAGCKKNKYHHLIYKL